MGSFNVACSISGISLGPSDEVVFIPLVIKHYNLGKEYSTWRVPSQYIIYPDDFFSPLCLPIRGKYDDYGGIEEVVKDDNVLCIENFLGFPAEEIPDHIARRGVYDYFSATAKRFLPAISELSNYETTLDKRFLEVFGFKHIGRLPHCLGEEDIYEYNDYVLPCFISVIGNTYNITDDKGDPLATFDTSDKNRSSQFKDEFLRTFSNLSNYYVGVAKEHQNIVKLLSSMSGMFVHAKIYDALTTKSYGESYGRKYSDCLDEYIKTLQEGINKENMTKEERAIQRLKEMEQLTFISDWHRSWYKFVDIFKKALTEGKLRKEFIDYSVFTSNMYAMNRFYFPAMNGEQCGNYEASLILAKKTVELLEIKIKEYEEDDLNDEEFPEDVED